MGPSGYTISGGQNFDKFTSEAQDSGEVKVYQSVPTMWHQGNRGEIASE